MSANAGIRIGFAVVGAVLGVMTGGIGGLLISAAFMALGSIVANAVAPLSQAATNDQISYTTTSETQCVPVHFGVCRCSLLEAETNWLFLKSSTSGGKGMSSGSTGQTSYALQYAQIIGMGQIDGVYAVLGSNENNYLPNHNYQKIIDSQIVTVSVPIPIEFTGDVMELPLAVNHAAPGTTGDGVGGIARVYRGSPTQTRITAGDLYNVSNYRNFAWVLYGPGGGFGIGYSKNLPNLAWVVWRWPKCLMDDGSDAGIATKGSAFNNHIHYHAANPAAVLWECYTNKTWGKGVSSSLMDQASFQALSQWCLARDYGINFSLTSRVKLQDVENTVLNCYKLRVVQQNGLYTLVNLDWLPNSFRGVFRKVVDRLDVHFCVVRIRIVLCGLFLLG